jgi:hypothetical protein
MKKLILLTLLFSAAAQAQVPQHLNYQGRVAVHGTNFHGTGQFKFALVVPSNQNQTATATGFATAILSTISVNSGGSGYTTPPAVTIAPPDDPEGVQATATATIAGGVVTEITINVAGSGYFNNPVQVTIAPPPENIEYQVYWSNAGDLAPGEVPSTSVSLPVDKGLYSVALGDTSVTNMAAFNPDIFYTPLFLRVWFSDGVNGFQQLTPDQPLASAPYALQARLAESVAPNSIGGAQLANGAVGSAKLAPGAAAENLESSGQSGVGSGGVILSASINPALAADGYVKMGVLNIDERWEIGTTPLSLDSQDRVGVWTGSKLFIWGSRGLGGGLYDPDDGTWTPLSGSAPNAPVAVDTMAVWTGSEVIVWGGLLSGQYVNSGGRYNPASNTWTAIPGSLPNTPAGRASFTAVWTGSKMIVWGGQDSSGSLSTGGIFDPQGNGGAGSWTPTPSVSGTGLSPRTGHSAIWDGSRMIVWGGVVAGGAVVDTSGALTETSPGVWQWVNNFASLMSGPSPTARWCHNAVWTGTEMIVYGGYNSGGAPQSTGARLNTQTLTWLPLPTQSLVVSEKPAVWTGSDMVLFAPSARYSLAENAWRDLIAPPLFSVGGADDDAYWTGTQMLITGDDDSRILIWNPARRMFLYQRP